MAAVVLLHWTRCPPELKNRKSSTPRPWPIAWFLNICTEVFHNWPSTKITKMASPGWTKWRQELKIEKKNLKRHLRSHCPDFKVISQKCSSYGPSPKLPKKVLLSWTKMAARAKNRKKNFKHLLLGQWPDWKWFHRNVPLIPLYQNCQNFALLNKMVTRAKNRKTFKRHLRDQWQDFKIILHQYTSYAPLPKLLKWFCFAEQNRAKNRKENL